MTKVSLKELG